jgi:hypothetical protein
MSVVSVEKPSFLFNLFCLGPYRYLIRTAVLGLVLLSSEQASFGVVAIRQSCAD